MSRIFILTMFLLSTDSLRGYGINRIFSFAKDAGFGGIELAMDVRLFDTQNAEYLKSLKTQYGLPVQVVSAFANSTIKQTSLVLETAYALGAKVVVLEPPRFFDFKYKDWIKKQVPLLRKKYNLMVALKNGPSEYLWGFLPGRSMSSIPDLQNFKEVCLDVSNLFEKKIDLMRAYDVMKPYLRHVHLSNVYRGIDHNVLENGIMPLESFLTKLNNDGYDHDITLLVKPKVLSAGDDKAVMKTLEKQLKFYSRYMG